MNTLFSSGTHTSVKFHTHPWNGNMAMYIPQKNITLSRLSMVSIITNLWMNGKLKEHLENVFESNKNLLKARFSLIKTAKELVKQFELPSLVMRELLIVLEWISLDFIAYLDRLLNNEFFSYKGNISNIVKNIKWDMHGGIDEVQTFKNMKYTNYHYNYIVSTLYCLEYDIPKMWESLSTAYRPLFSTKKMYTGGFDSYATFIIYYWTCRVKNREFYIHSLEDPIGLFNEIRNSTIELKMLVVSLNSYNIYAFKYFWRRLNNEERKQAVVILCDIYELDDLSSLSNFYDAIKNSVEIIVFVLSQIDDEQRLTVIQRCLSNMIVNFWQYWQVHHVILPLFENYVKYLDTTSYRELLKRLQAQNNEYSPKGRILHKIWLSSPPHLQCVLDETERQQILTPIQREQTENHF